MLERLKAENEEVMKSYSDMIDIVSDMVDKCERQALRIQDLELRNKELL